MLRPVPVTDGLELAPGEFFVSFAAPSWLLDAALQRPGWASDAARFVLERTGRRVEFRGGGVAWERVEGELERTFTVRLVVLEPDEGVPVIEAGVSLRAIAAAVAAAFGLVLALSVVRVVELVTDPERRPVLEGVAPAPLRGLLALGALGVAGVLIVRGRWWS